MTLEEELQLIEQAKFKRGAFIELYNLYLNRVYKYCYMRLPTEEIAEDIVSTVFMKLVENIKNIDTGRGLRLSAWIFRVAHNEIVDYYKSKKSEEFDWDNTQIESDQDIEEFLMDHSRQQVVASTLVELNSRYQKVISLKFFAQLETSEIAAQMEIKADGVYVLLHRALQAFEKEFEKKYGKSERFI